MNPIRVGIIMNGVTGRMGTNQHLVRSIDAIRAQGGVALADGARDHARPDPRRPQRGKGRGAREGARRRALDDRPRRARSPNATTRSTSTRRPRACAPSCPQGDRGGQARLLREADRADARRRARPVPPRAGGRRASTASCRTSCGCPGLLKLKTLIDSGFFGRILSVRGEFGYWVFEGDWQPAQRPSWNYRKEDGGGIIVDMLCHWRYVLDNLFGSVKCVSCLGATHIPERWDESGQPLQRHRRRRRVRDIRARATAAIVAQFNSSWCTRVRRDDLLTFQVDGTHGSAVAGLARMQVQQRATTPKPVWNPDVPQTIDFYDTGRSARQRRLRQRVQGRVGAVPAPRRRRRPVPMEPARGREGRAARRARA